jgi:ribosomal protein S18 acetylase RimI-like enzyme
MPVIRYRSFCNTDPPQLVNIWRSHPPLRGLMQPMSVELLERVVLSKPYFEREGLIIAEHNGQPLGFVHGGFGPNSDRSEVSYAQGATCMLMIMPHAEQNRIRGELLQRSEHYLVSRGARRLYGGARWPMTPFYLGLYGGSGLPGVLDADRPLDDLYASAGYTEWERWAIWQRELAGFRAPIDRRQVRIGRDFEVRVRTDEPTGTWWQACTIDQAFHMVFQLVPRSAETPCAQLTFWDMEPLASGWGVHAMGMLDLQVDPQWRGRGLAKYLVAESLRQLQGSGVTLVEAQASATDEPVQGLLKKLGFVERERATLFGKSLPVSGEDRVVSDTLPQQPEERVDESRPQS